MNEIKTEPGEVNLIDEPRIPLLDQGHLTPAQITDHFRALYNSADTHILAIIANSINSYAEAKVRMTSNAKFSPEDARRLLDIILIHVDTPNVG